MSGTGETVEFTKLFKKGPLTQADKNDLKEKVNKIIDKATDDITIESLVKTD